MFQSERVVIKMRNSCTHSVENNIGAPNVKTPCTILSFKFFLERYAKVGGCVRYHIAADRFLFERVYAGYKYFGPIPGVISISELYN